MNRAVFLDRDGIVNKAIVKDGKPYPPKDVNQIHFIKYFQNVMNRLKKEGFKVFVFTNQPDVARGTQTKEQVEKINNYIFKKLPIDKIYCCYHDDKDNCECRKPKPGMILQAAKEFDIDLKKSWVIGDRSKDIEAGIAAGCKTIFVDYGYKEKLNCKPSVVIKYIEGEFYES